jgi:hypothetical protein
MRERKLRIGKRQNYDLKTQRIIPSENDECKAFWQFLVKSNLSDDWIKHANERMGDPKWFIKNLFHIGFRKGLPDYQFIMSNKTYHNLWIEMKRIDQRNVKKKLEQDEWIARLLKRGHYASYAYGCEDAIRIYRDYVNNRI